MVVKPQRKLGLSKSDLADDFRSSRGQTKDHSTVYTPRGKSNTSTFYQNFLKRYNDLENTIDSLGTRDLVYYFREIANENGFKYVISNIQKDIAIMKRLKTNYSNREICGMIEFLYESEQDYLDKSRLSLNLLASQWINTIYADMQLWVEDKYVPKSKQDTRKKAIKQREWNSEDDSSDVKIGAKF